MVNTTVSFKDGETLTIKGKYTDAIRFGSDTHLTICGEQNNTYVIDASTVKYVKVEVNNYA